MTLPGWLTEPLGWIGLEWPQADETKLFDAGSAWLTFGIGLVPISTTANGAANSVWTTNSGDVTEAFRTWWTGEDGPTKRLSDDMVASTLIGAALIVFAGITLAMKIAFLVQLAILAYQVAAAIAAAFFSFGASTAAIPGFVAATRMICSRLLRKAVDVVQTAISKLLKNAKDLLKKVRNTFKRSKGPNGANNPLSMRSIRDRYRGEMDPNDPNRWNFPQVLHTMSPEELARHRVRVGPDGKLYGPDGRVIDSATARTFDDRANSIYVMDRNGNLYVSNYQNVGTHHHSTFLGGDDVAGAGEIYVDNGVVRYLDRSSGHYRPLPEHLEQVIDQLRRQGVDLSQVSIGGI
jgi:hypothetical protein